MKPNEVNKAVRTIALEMAQSPVSPRKYQRFSKQLDHALVTIQNLETKNKTANLFAKALTEGIKEQIVNLYGDLENRRVHRQISQIKKETEQVKEELREGRVPPLRTVKNLEIHIHGLEKNHLPSSADRPILVDARQALLEANEKLNGQLKGKPAVRHFDWLASQKNVHVVEKIELLPGEVEELLDIARAVYNRDFSQAKRRYATLPSDHKRRFEKHMQNLMAKPFVDALETMQGMIATVNELVENGEGYPTSDGIDQLFIGLSQVTAEESAEGKIFSFPPQASLGG